MKSKNGLFTVFFFLGVLFCLKGRAQENKWQELNPDHGRIFWHPGASQAISLDRSWILIGLDKADGAEMVPLQNLSFSSLRHHGNLKIRKGSESSIELIIEVPLGSNTKEIVLSRSQIDFETGFFKPSELCQNQHVPNHCEIKILVKEKPSKMKIELRYIK